MTAPTSSQHRNGASDQTLANRPPAAHVSEAPPSVADRPTLGYTLAGFPSGNLRAARGRECG
jgi:hypothetical protein